MKECEAGLPVEGSWFWGLTTDYTDWHGWKRGTGWPHAELVLGVLRVPQRGCGLGARRPLKVGLQKPHAIPSAANHRESLIMQTTGAPQGCHAVGEGGKFGHEFERGGRMRPSARRVGRRRTIVRAGPRNNAIGRSWHGPSRDPFAHRQPAHPNGDPQAGALHPNAVTTRAPYIITRTGKALQP